MHLQKCTEYSGGELIGMTSETEFLKSVTSLIKPVSIFKLESNCFKTKYWPVLNF